MVTCQKYKNIHPLWQSEIEALIRGRMTGKSNIADILIEDSELCEYQFKVTVMKYNSRKGWATIGYIRQDNAGDKWYLAFNPRKRKVDVSTAGKTASYQ